MPQTTQPSHAGPDYCEDATRLSSREDDKWPPLATFLFVVLVSSIGWAAALYPITR